MDGAERVIRDALAREAERIDAQAFVLAHGTVHVPIQRPPGVPAGERHQTFRNALRLARERPDLRYCEGYSLPAGAWETDPPNRHAWCVDADGRAIDPTPGWAEPGGRLRPCYLGVPIGADFAAPHVEGGKGVLYELTGRIGLLAAELFPDDEEGLQPGV